LIIDLGAAWKGQHADMTRMHVPDGNRRIQKMFRQVTSIQEKIIPMCVPGVKFLDLQKAYVSMLKRMGYRVPHFIGHGVGRAIHERVVDMLEKGIVITVEPGIYVKGFAGCRIEDMVLVKSKPRILTKSVIMPQ